MTLNQMLVTTKAVEDWLENKRSRVGEVKKIKKKMSETIRQQLARGREVSTEEISEEDIENYTRMLEDKDYQSIYKYMSPSSLKSFIEEAKENKEDEEFFTNKVLRYVEIGNDNNVKRSLENILRLVYRQEVKK